MESATGAETDDGETDDGETDDGETDDGETDEINGVLQTSCRVNISRPLTHGEHDSIRSKLGVPWLRREADPAPNTGRQN